MTKEDAASTTITVSPRFDESSYYVTELRAAGFKVEVAK